MAETILITGITGFVGSHLADLVLAKGPGYRVVGTKRWHLSRMHHIAHIRERISLVDCDLTDPIATRNMMAEVKPSKLSLVIRSSRSRCGRPAAAASTVATGTRPKM